MNRQFSVLIKFLIPILILGIFWGWPARAQETLPIFEYKELRRAGVERYVPDEIIVKFKPGVPQEKISEIYRQEQIPQEKYISPYAGFRVLKIPAGKTVEEMVYRFQKNPLVDYAEPNSIAYAFMVPNDPYYQYQWHFDDDHTRNPGGATSNPYGGTNGGGIRMEEAWDITTGSANVIVAVVDTGIRKGTDLAATCFVLGWDFVNNDSDPTDDDGHGTHVAGTVAQSTNNGVGVAGVAFGTCLMPVKVLGPAGGTYQQVADGIYYAANNGAKIINLSLGGTSPSETLEDAVEYADDIKGVTVFAACGNENASSCIYPAAYDAYVIAVGATRYDEQKTDYSNYGTSLDLTAPGGQSCIDSFAPTCVMNDQNEDGYWDGVLQQTFEKRGARITWNYYFFDGTSMATPHVAGVAALILSQNPTFTPDQVRQRLQSTAEDKGATGWDQYYGWGIVDTYAALSYSPVAISITTDGTIEFGTAALEATVNSLGDVQTIHVDTGPVDLKVKSTNFSGGTNYWNLATTNGANQVKWDFSKEGSAWINFIAADTLYGLVNNLATGDNQNIYFQLLMPTTTSSYNQHGVNVTVVATTP